MLEKKVKDMSVMHVNVRVIPGPDYIYELKVLPLHQKKKYLRSVSND